MIERFVEGFHGTEGVCFPLRTRYSTNAAIAECADRVLKCKHINEIKLAENVKNKRLIDLFESLGSSKSDRQKIARELNLSADLLEELIVNSLLFIDRDDITVKFLNISDILYFNFSDSLQSILH